MFCNIQSSKGTQIVKVSNASDSHLKDQVFLCFLTSMACKWCHRTSYGYFENFIRSSTETRMHTINW